MPQLPRVAVLGAGPTGVAALYGLVDGGLWAAAIDVYPTDDADGGAPTAATAFAARFGLLDRIRLVPGPVAVRAPERGVPFTVRGGATATHGADERVPIPDRPATLNTGSDEVAGPDHVTVADVVVVADPRLVPDVRATDRARLFLGIFDPERDRVFHVGPGPGSGEAADGGPGEEIRMRVAAAQGRLLGEHLRGRYLLPPLPEVVADGPSPAARRTVARLAGAFAGRVRSDDPTTGYLRAMRRELARGHARAGAAGYPLPWPRLG